ncbi:hypothetical protein PIB30_100234 [Stylosanthes scabra]|uniref:Uncharacterized protein n=1 Tax=Stylosanthes scabra TaxID=79078 RepID=A0ABU6QY46_9FABA|nr:hypothetical protein [Stylosanthes scabra]
MGRCLRCCGDESSGGVKKGPWTPEEDQKLLHHIHKHGHRNWRLLPKLAGLNRCGKSCRLRWINYLRPGIKREKFSQEEEQTILHLHSILGNKWSTIASYLPWRTDNDIKNFWNTRLKKKLIQMGIDPVTHQPVIIDHYSMVEHALRLQQELEAQLANLRYLQIQYLSTISSYDDNLNGSIITNMEPFGLLNSISTISNENHNPVIHFPQLDSNNNHNYASFSDGIIGESSHFFDLSQEREGGTTINNDNSSWIIPPTSPSIAPDDDVN